MREDLFRILLTAVLLLGIITPLQSQQVEKGPYLLFPGDNTQMTVLWQLDTTTSSTLAWGLDTMYTGGSVQTTEYGSDHQHKVVISNLTPGATYYYRVTVNGTHHAGSFLAAPPASVENVKFLAYGDTRSYPADHDAVNAQMINTYTADPAYQTFTVHVGDWVNDGDTESDWTDEFFGRTRSNTIEMQANLSIQGCMGNHEYSGVLYEKYWPYPFEAGGRYWSYDYGPVHVVVLDQYVSYSAGSTQLTWLENDLAASDREWKVIVLHEPGYSAGGHSNDSDVQQYIQPLCVQYEVDIVFCGHNHYYARCEVDGVQHITVGGGGAPLYAPNYNADYLVTAAEVLHFGEIDIQGEQLDFVARDVDGNVFDTFTASHVFVPALPWSDGFESGDLTTGGWITTGRISVQSEAYSGSFAPRTDRAATMTKSISTGSFTGIHVKYARKTFGLDAGEYFLAEWYDGSNWHEIETTQATTWGTVDYACPAGADNNRMFKVRFSAVGTDKKEYIFIDDVEVVVGTSEPDTTPPNPDPLTWATAPNATGSTTISMTATTATDVSGVQYYFESTSTGGHDSGWQDSPVYEDTGLTPDTQYTYRVKARDKSPNSNETGYTAEASAVTNPAGGSDVYVADIAMTTTNKGPNYTGVATVSIEGTGGVNIAGATVTGTWTGSVSGTAQGVTASDGTVVFTSPKKKNGGTFTFTVTGITKTGYTYNPALNVETSDTISI
ncbi:MAG: metallophosphoesterase family protein [bacterium]|nr:metallophosphoesterase family protein [bacterium]